MFFNVIFHAKMDFSRETLKNMSRPGYVRLEFKYSQASMSA